MLTTGPRGTNDVLPAEAPKWRYLEDKIREICHQYGYAELRPPVFEHTELFQRGVGEATDIVEKEMYTFSDRGGRSLTLRPEFTAGLVRAYLEHKLYAGAQPAKLWSFGPGFRYERPQAGRFRQFNQWDVEVFGSQHPAVDAEVIQIGLALAERLGLKGLIVHLNSIGCPICRPVYREKLREHYRPHLEELCESCRSRYDRNPLRLIDCKEEGCKPLAAGAPTVIDCLCEECAAHFREVQRYLKELGVEYDIDTRIVRGLDYYTKTVFEVIYPPLGAQSTVWGGGRYDGLMETLGGPPTPGVGYAMGVERMLSTLELMKVSIPEPQRMDVFIATVGERAFKEALPSVYRLRAAGLSAEIDYLGRSLKAQMKYAGKYRARYVAIVGEEELNRGAAVLRDMDSGSQEEVRLSDLPAEVSRRKTG